MSFTIRSRGGVRPPAPTGWATALLFVLAFTACDLDLENPNDPTEEEVITDTEGLIALAVGMQGDFALQVEEFIQAPALVTDEWGTTTTSLLSYRTLLTGENFDRTFGIVEEPFADAYEVVASANTLLEGVPNVIEGAGLSAGLLSLAKLYKAMALGTIIQQFEEVPIEIDRIDPVPQPREVVLDTVLLLLESARDDLAGVQDEDLEGLRTRVLHDGFDLRNTIDAMLARYSLIAGEYQDAIEAAERVDLSVTSTFAYPPPGRNPIENLSLQLNYVAALASFAEEAEPGDDRVDFWVDRSVEPFAGNPPDTLLLPLNQYDAPQDPYFVYMPDEMRLIRAEAHARLQQFGMARDLINTVRTGGAVPMANLPELLVADLDTEDELLTQIAYERRYELYMQGLRWEDMRRLSDYIEREPTLDFLPLPEQECLANPSAGC